MATTPATIDTRIVVIELPLDGDPVVVGLVADKVLEVTHLSQTGTQSTPTVGFSWRPEFIRHIAKWNETFVIVPELHTLLN